MLHDAKKSLRLIAIYGMMLLLQLLCLMAPIIVSCYQFWQHISKKAVCTFVQIKNVLNQQEEVILLLFLLRLLYITLCTHFLLLALTGMVPIMFMLRIAAYLLRFFLFRHCRIIGAGITIVVRACTAQQPSFICWRMKKPYFLWFGQR